jgi:ribosomal subunit interface protein
VDIVVKGRNVEVPEHFRVHVAEKLTRSERYDPKIIRVDVELSHETNRRQSKTCQRVQITLASRGPAVRAEASAETFYAALDSAVTKLEARLRRAADRRHHRHHERTPIGAVATQPDELMDGAAVNDGPVSERPVGDGPVGDGAVDSHVVAADGATGAFGGDIGALGDVGADLLSDEGGDGGAPDGGPGRIVRVKDHPADPITVDQALFQMELVGHDFYLFNDADTHLASVVYRRKGFDYGLLRLG